MTEKFYKNLPSIYTRKSGVLYAIIYAIASLFDDFETDYKAALSSAGVITAEGFWLDFWGYLLNMKRFANEYDDDYRFRLLTFIRLGIVTRAALIATARPFSKTEPILTEHNGTILQNDNYTAYTYDFKNHLMTLTYTPQFTATSGAKTFFIGKSYIGYNTYLTKVTSRYSVAQLKEILNNIKMAGVKLIHKIG